MRRARRKIKRINFHVLVFTLVTLPTIARGQPATNRNVPSLSPIDPNVLATTLEGDKRLQEQLDSQSAMGIPWTGGYGIREIVSDIMLREMFLSTARSVRPEKRIVKIRPERKGLPQNPESPRQAQWPLPETGLQHPASVPMSPQTLGTSFTGATLAGINPTGAFPADVMGAVGPTQFVVMVNNRVVSFNKTTGVADGVINATTNAFFNSVRNASGTTDPRIRYDRLSNRWFFVMINVSTPNRILIGVTDAASAGVISGSTVITFFFIPIDTTPPGISATCFMDYPTLGVDNNALYIGGNNFCGAVQTFNSTDGYVVRKTSVLGAGPLIVTVFRGLVPTPSSDGPYTPQGVDNYDAASTEGYFVGVSNLFFGTLMLRRVGSPGGTPTISSDISVIVNATEYPASVAHLGNTGGLNGNLDGLDDRLFAAHIRNGRLWTAHNIEVDETGVATFGGGRNGSRWYELQNVMSPGIPTIRQSGTVFDPAVTNPTSYWIPSVLVSGQGHAALGFSNAGSANRVNAGTVGRLSGDILGTVQTPIIYTSSSTAYNPPGDPGGPRRWGDYSYTSLDPQDDMTMWTIQDFCDATNSYGARAVQLIAPPPAAPSSASPNAVAPLANVAVVITGTSASGSGFYDPGTGFTNRIAASVLPSPGAAGSVSVTSVTYTDPTHVTLNLNTDGANGYFKIRITNPDGQIVTSPDSILRVDPALPIQLATFTGAFVNGNNVRLNWITISEINNYGFEVQQSTNRLNNFETIAGSFIPGHGTTNQPQYYTYLHSTVSPGSYWYRLKQIDLDGSTNYVEPIMVSSVTTVLQSAAPAKFSLAQNYPNPFNPSTEIKFSVESSGPARLDVFNITGQQVATLFNETAIVGQYYKVKFDATNFPSGVYLYKLSSGTKSELKKLVLLK